MMLIKRVWIGSHGAFGVASWHGLAPFCVTLERTYPEGNRQMVKIPPGLYSCVRSRYFKGGYDCWQIVGGIITPERRILIHKANAEEELDGCIAVGEQFDPFKGKPGILRSGKAFQELMALSADVDEFPLTIINT